MLESGGTTPDKVLVLLAFEWNAETNVKPLPPRLWGILGFFPFINQALLRVYNRLTCTLLTMSELQGYAVSNEME
jgi:hypothetical protein